MEDCQNALHTWGYANQVQFDAAKESHHVLHRHEQLGNDFRMLGVQFDCQLRMESQCHDMAKSAGWKLRTILRPKRFYTANEVVVAYKCHVLSYLEFATPAVYHARKYNDGC